MSGMGVSRWVILQFMHIGIFDSGRGGRFVAAKLKRLLPQHTYTVIDDRSNAPYGERGHIEIRELTFRAIEPLLTCDIVVLACNTATAAALDELRRRYPSVSFVGFEPMIKPAASASRNHHITLLCTAATAKSPRTKQLIDLHANNITIDIANTFGWATAVDASDTDSINLDEVAASINAGSDTIIIGCTHYIALMPRLADQFPGVTILEPTEAIARRITQLEPGQPQ